MAVSDSLASVAAALQMPGRPTVSAGEQPAAGTAARSLRERLFDECAGLLIRHRASQFLDARRGILSLSI